MSTDRVAGDDAVEETPVRVSYRHANLRETNESVLLRFARAGSAGAHCVLFDAGSGVDLDALLGPEDALAAVCLTHAHYDHYCALGETLPPETPVYAAPGTAAVFGDVLDVAAADRGAGWTDDVRGRVRAVDGWQSVAPGVDVHPVPAGHAPGAAGFLVRFVDAGDPHHLLVTGDFTRTDVAGFPGFETDLGVDVEAVFLTVATSADHRTPLTDALGDALAGAAEGGPTLVTASGLTGVHLAVLLAAAGAELGVDAPVRVVGQVAKHYEALGYDHDRVTAVPVFDDEASCLGGGVVTVAGPEVPVDRSSSRLFRRIEQNPAATLVQVHSGARTPAADADTGCATSDHELSMHPSRTELDEVVAALDPATVVVVHRPGGAGREFNDWGPCVWSPTADERFDLYDSRWLTPPWMSTPYARSGGGPTRIGDVVGGIAGDPPVPRPERSSVDLRAEGVDLDRLRARLDGPGDGAPAGTPASDGRTRTARTTDGTPRETDSGPATTEADSGPATTETDPEPIMSEDDPEPTDAQRNRLYDTTGASLDADAAADAGTAERAPGAEPPSDIVAARARRQIGSAGGAGDDDGEATGDGDGDGDDGGEGDGEDTGRDREPSAAGVEDADAAGDADATGEGDDGDGESDGGDAAAGSGGSATPGAPDREPNAPEATLDPFVVALVERSTDDPVSEFVADAVESYLSVLVAGGDPPVGADAVAVSVAPPLEDLLSTLVADDPDVDSVPTLVRSGLAAALCGAGDGEADAPEAALDPYRSLLAAAAANESNGFESPAAVVTAAVVAALLDRTDAT